MEGCNHKVSVTSLQGVTQGGLTLPGFLFLIALFYEKGRIETVWAMLRTYGYNNDLRLSDEMLSEVSFSHASDQVIEISWQHNCNV